MSFVAIVFAFISVSVALPNQEADVHNVITVPPNCPPGQELVNGHCRDIWIWRNNPNTAGQGAIDPSVPLWLRNRNVITVPTNCPPGQQLINGVCRDVWRYFLPTTPLPKQIDNSDVEQRNRRQAESEVNIVDFFEVVDEANRNIINIPKQCPEGYRPDALGNCRQILN